MFWQNSFIFCTLVQSYDPICHGNEGFVESQGGEHRKKNKNRLFMMICYTDIHMPFDNGDSCMSIFLPFLLCHWEKMSGIMTLRLLLVSCLLAAFAQAAPPQTPPQRIAGLLDPVEALKGTDP